jgi:ribonuclease BN (tRNA processing enzyme)
MTIDAHVALRFWGVLVSVTMLSSSLVFAQSGGPPSKATSDGTTLITLGTTAGPMPRKDRAQAANVLTVGGTPYLIDAGDGAMRRLVQADVEFLKIGTIFITHHHSDHMAGLASVLNAQWEYNRQQPTHIYGPPGTRRVIDGAIQYLSVNAEIRSSEGKITPLRDMFIAHEVGTGTIFEDKNVKVIATENTHYNFPPGSAYATQHKSYSYRFETPGRVIVFSGDTGPSAAVEELAKGADVLVCETVDLDEVRQRRIDNGSWQKMSPAAQEAWTKHITDEHLTPEQVGKLATKAGVKSVILSHLSVDGTGQQYADKVKATYSGPVTVAADLMRF